MAELSSRAPLLLRIKIHSFKIICVSQMADTPNAELRVAAEDGLALVNEMENLKEAGISPQYYGDAAKALILLWGTKIGV